VKGVEPSRSGETSRLGSRDLVAERDQVWASWWKKSKMKS
jgi:hypothetical protein